MARGNPNWVKGQSGNNTGRPKGSTSKKTLVQDAFLQVLEGTDPTTKKTNLELFLKQFTHDALNNNKSYAHKIFVDRLFEEGILDDIDAKLNRAKREDVSRAKRRLR